MKKTILIALGAIAALALAYFGYKWYKKNKAAGQPTVVYKPKPSATTVASAAPAPSSITMSVAP